MTLFGGLKILRPDGARARFSTRKAEQLFLYLAVIAPQRAPRTVLASMFWSDRGEDQARSSLRRALSDTRAALGNADAVRADRLVACCDPDIVRVDAREVLALAASRRPADLEALAARALAPLLPDLDPASEPFGHWLRDWRAGAEARILDALRARCALLADAGRADEALAAAEQICALDPACEPTARFLIEARAGRGERQAALERFERLRVALAAAYDAAPEPETFALVARLRLGAVSPAPPSRGVGEAPPEAQASPPRADTGPLELRRGAVLALRRTPDHQAEKALEPFLADEAGLASARAAIEAAGGHVVGGHDGVLMGVFGAPVAYGDDVSRAHAASLSVRAALGRSAENTVLALAVGDVLADLRGGEPVVSGPALRTAAELCRKAGPGTLALDPGAERELGRGAILDARVARAEGRQTEDAPFVGRDIERAQVVTALRSALGRARGRVVILRGEPGIGKTRLAQRAMADLADEGMQGVTAHVLDFGGRSRRDAVREALRALHLPAGVDPERAAARLLDALAAEGSRVPVLYDLLDLALPARLAGALDAIPVAARAQLRCTLVADLFALAARERPLVALFEDVHWADSGTLSGLAAIAGATRDAPLSLLLTTRIEGDRLGADWRAETGGAAVDTMDLAPFDRVEAEELAAALGVTRQARIRRCIDRAGGNPLFLAQLLRHGSDAASDDFPLTIQSVVQARLDLLDPAHRSLLQTASVFGQSFEREALTALAGATAPEIDRLAQHGMLRSEPGGYRFAHALVRDAIYATLLPSRRRTLHRALAHWFADRDDTLVAEHLEHAGDPEAADAYAHAARNQSRAYRYTRAAELARKGLAAAVRAEQRAELGTLLGEALLDLGDVAGAREAFEDALAAAPGSGLAAEARLGLAGVRRITDDLDGAFADLKEADRLAGRDGPSAMRARIRFLEGNLHFPRGEVEACRRAHEEALAFARAAGSAELEAMALGGLGDAAYLAGKMRTAHERLGACVSIAQANGLGRIAVANATQRANAGVFLMPPEAAFAELCAARDRAREVGNLRAELNGCAGTLWTLFEMGRYGECLAVADEADELIARSGARRYRQLSLAMRGRALLRIADRDSARAVLEEARAFAAETGLAFHGPEIMLGLAEAADGLPAAHRALSDGEAIIATGCVGHGPLRFYPAAARLMSALGDTAAARTFARTAAGFHPEERMSLPLP